MGEFIKDLLSRGSSVGLIAEAMKAAPRPEPRGLIDQPVASERRQQQETMGGQPSPQAGGQPSPQAGGQPSPQAGGQPSPQDQEAEMLAARQQGKPKGKAPSSPEGDVLTREDQLPPAEGDSRSGAAMIPPTQEEEKQARALMANVTDFLYGEGLDKVTNFLKAGKEPPKAVGEVTAMLVSGEMDAAEMAGKEISPNILMSVGAEVVQQVYELAAALGVWAPKDAEQADKDMGLALNYASNLFVNSSVQTGRKDRLNGLPKAMQDIEAGKYDSKPGQPMTNDMAPVTGGGM